MHSADQPRPGVTVAVDARAIDASGIGRYLREILSRLLRDDRFGGVTLLGSPDRLREFIGTLGSAVEVDVERYDHPFYSAAAQLDWLRIRREGRARTDVVFLPHYDGPVLGLPRRSVVTVQDLIHFKVPEAFPLAKRAAAGVLLRRVCRQAGRIIVTSEATRADIEDRLPYTAGRTVVIPLGVSEFFLRDDEKERVPSPVDGDYLLCVGNQKAHKNQLAAVEALRRLRGVFPTLRLVVAGRAYDGADLVRERAHALGLGDAVVEIPEPTDEQLRSLYRGCRALLFPSLYEGFGLPVLEAMASGVPVVASRRASIPEVAGDAALLIDPTDFDEVSSAVETVLRDTMLRERLVRAGRARARQFSWDTTAARVLQELLQVGGRNRAEPDQRGPILPSRARAAVARQG